MRNHAPMPFNQILCADLAGWTGDIDVLGRVAASVDVLEDDYGAAVALLERALTLNTGCASAWMRSGIVRGRDGRRHREPEDRASAGDGHIARVGYATAGLSGASRSPLATSMLISRRG
jgi:hypothetical protein